MWAIPVEALIDQPATSLSLCLYSLDQSIDIYLHSVGGDMKWEVVLWGCR